MTHVAVKLSQVYMTHVCVCIVQERLLQQWWQPFTSLAMLRGQQFLNSFRKHTDQKAGPEADQSVGFKGVAAVFTMTLTSPTA